MSNIVEYLLEEMGNNVQERGAFLLGNHSTIDGVSIEGFLMFPVATAIVFIFAKVAQNVLLFGTLQQPQNPPRQTNYIGFGDLIFWLMSVTGLTMVPGFGSMIVPGNIYGQVLIGMASAFK